MACCHDNCDHEQRHEDARGEAHEVTGAAPAGCCGGHGPGGGCEEHERIGAPHPRRRWPRLLDHSA